MPYNPLQIREAFHLCFLQEFLRKFDPKLVVLKGGVNLRFFFKSRRYSEDMDLDVKTASVATVRKNVLQTLTRLAFPMRIYGVTEIVPPSMAAAKQTETTQRFKIHLITQDGLELFTKIEFSRRGLKGETQFERVDESLLRNYRLSPVIVQHYAASIAFDQKISALAGRPVEEARDVFDLHHLLSFLPKDYVPSSAKNLLKKAAERAQEISYEQYRESVVAYLMAEDQNLLGRKEVWEEMKRVLLASFEKWEELR